jgi:DNA-binding NarL/FixJ family response regulator
MPSKITILLADNNDISLAGTHALLKTSGEIEILGEARNKEELLNLIGLFNPQCVVMELFLPLEEFIKKIRSRCSSPILILTSYSQDKYLYEMIQAGVEGILSKEDSAQKLLTSLREVAHGNLAISPDQLARATQWHKKIGVVLEELTNKEKAILSLIARAVENSAIANTLNISEKTVAYHLTHIFIKLGVKSRLEAAIWAKDNLPDNLE